MPSQLTMQQIEQPLLPRYRIDRRPDYPSGLMTVVIVDLANDAGVRLQAGETLLDGVGRLVRALEG